VSAAYVDSSVLVATAFSEEGSGALRDRLLQWGRLYSSNLLEAEVRSALAREGFSFAQRYVARIRWVYPFRPLTEEIETVLEAGYLRGADLWHVANALYAFPRATEVGFFTLDERQRAVAAELGFQV
jgi:predicted nucleic acid-binding protein